jgi:hypothetical protein
LEGVERDMTVGRVLVVGDVGGSRLSGVAGGVEGREEMGDAPGEGGEGKGAILEGTTEETEMTRGEKPEDLKEKR